MRYAGALRHTPFRAGWDAAQASPDAAVGRLGIGIMARMRPREVAERDRKHPGGPTRVLSGRMEMSTASQVARVAGWLDAHPDFRDVPADKYGRGGLVEALEEQAAGLLGVDATLLFPSGTMAQQVALQVWRTQTGSDVVALDRNSHLVRFEDDAVEVLSGLAPAIITAGTAQITADDVRSFDGKFGSLVLELPLRELGFLLPPEAELTALVNAVHERGAFVHVDGARLWESAPHFGMPLDNIIRHFGIDSAYLGLDKALGAPSGALLAGSTSFVEAAKPWRHRYGGRPHESAFVAAAALMAIEQELPRLPQYVAHAPVVAKALSAVDGLAIYPNPPNTNQFQVWAHGESRELGKAGETQTERTGTRLFSSGWRDSQIPGLAVNEVTVAGPALAWSSSEISAAAAQFMDGVRGRSPKAIALDLRRTSERHVAPTRNGPGQALPRPVVYAPAPVFGNQDGSRSLPTAVRNSPSAFAGRFDRPVRQHDPAAKHAPAAVAVPLSPIPAPVAASHAALLKAATRGLPPMRPGPAPSWKTKQAPETGVAPNTPTVRSATELNRDPGLGNV